MHSTFSKLVVVGMFGTVTLLVGCTSTTPNYDSKFGDAVNAAKAQQTINPDASNKAHRTPGMDGKASKNVMDRYHKSFQSPPPPANVFTIGVGSGGGSSGGSN